ncbi:MAG: cyclase family protein [Lachnospiraceae bacterium]|nr:cyclase family protein [Lachnospiraceae bacterium]
MKIYDISQEVFSCTVFPGDPSPQKEIMMSMNDGSLYNLSALHMCAHNGTHVDAPYHFIENGKTIEQVSLEKFVGLCYVAEHDGIVTAEDATEILRKAETASKGCPLTGDTDSASKRILIKGNAEVSAEAARVFSDEGVLLVGNESQTVGPENAPMEVHLILLGAEVVLLEGIRLAKVPEGVYLLNAAPLNLGGADGAPCRAILLDMKKNL